MTTQQYGAKILDHLNTVWQARGVPQPMIAAALGLSTAQVSKRFNGHVQISAAELMVILETLGVSASDFFAGVNDDFHPELYLARLEKKDPRRRKYAKSDQQRDAPSRPYKVEQLQRIAESLQELRLVNANEACRQALEILRAVRHDGLDIGPRAECLARVALGAIYRGRGNWSTAAFFLREALRIAGDNGSLKGLTLQAVMSLAIDQGDRDSALSASQRAIVEYARVSDWCGLGRALVSQGILFWHYGDLPEAIASYQRSLSFLPEEEWFGRFAALHGLGLAHTYQCDLDEALANATQALATLNSREVPPLQNAAALWLRGEISLRKGLIDHAEKSFQEVMHIYEAEKVNDVDYALISLRMASAYQMSGKLDRIEEITSGLVARLRRWSARNKLVAGSIAQLHGSVIRGELSAQLIVGIYRDVLQGASLAPPAAQLALAEIS